MIADPDSRASTGRSALLLGATGLVGSRCLQRLLDDSTFARFRVLARRPLQRRHPRLEVAVVDFDRLAERRDLFRVDDVFCCLGTTIAVAGSQAAFRRVDHDYVVESARLAAEQGARQFLLVSAMGADARSRIFYNRVKGETEADVQRLPFQAVWILRPSLLLGERGEVRVGERIAEMVSKPLSFLLVGPLRRFRPIEADTVAAAMLRLAREAGAGGVAESDRLADLADR